MLKNRGYARFTPFTRSPEKYRMIVWKALENLGKLLGDIGFVESLDKLPKSIHQNAIRAWFHLGE